MGMSDLGYKGIGEECNDNINSDGKGETGGEWSLSTWHQNQIFKIQIQNP